MKKKFNINILYDDKKKYLNCLNNILNEKTN